MSQVTDAFSAALTAAGFDAWSATYGPKAGLLADDPTAHAAMVVSQFLAMHPEALAAIEPAFEALVQERPDLAFRLDCARAMAASHAGAPVTPWTPPPLTADDLRDQKLAAVGSVYAAKIAAGMPYAGQTVALDDASQIRFTAMGATALGVIGGALPAWPDEYSLGWIADSNDRIPLPTAEDGLKLASAAGAYTGALIQHGRDLKSAVLAAADPSAVDETAGWPS